ncbi:DUF5050 domain-containing protein [Alkalibacterium kapii]|uniref:Prolow-density lipoprotein receptor-related protein 1-like beta-propeller domain-containing protein n=1 Tax=Alkalibacterium kapii TaxID=426704 RepID=A0A511AW20_9LACT|nr:DUF5050 domain-containing protein [Alkalibacterium kapii]GEK91832.1 hypothetical protein AKA01nite_14540 [Alkalibacterium kapii]
MKNIKNWLNIAIRGTAFIYFPLTVIFFWGYREIFSMNPGIHWVFILLYLAVFLRWLIDKYRQQTAEIEVNSFDGLDRLIEQYKFEVLDIKQTEMIVRPTFDFPFNLILEDKIFLQHSNGALTIKGPKYYIRILEKNIKGKESLWTRKSVSSFKFITIIAFAILPIILESNLVWSMDVLRHNKFRNVDEKIEAISQETRGNTLENTMNGGLAAETDEAVYYIEDDMKLVKTDKQFQNKDYLIKRDGGHGFRDLNAVGDWLYFIKGERIERMKKNTGNHTAIYSLGYALNMQIYGDHIYFMSAEDDYNIYRMDLNGNDLKELIDVNALSLSLYDGRLLVSHEKQGQPIVKSYDLNGDDPEVILDVPAYDLTVWDGYYYYLNEAGKLYRSKIKGKDKAELLVNTVVSSYIPTEKGVVFSLSPSNDVDTGEGLYMLNLENGTENLLSMSKHIESMAKVGESILFTSGKSYDENYLKRFDLESGQVETLD